VIFWIWHVEGMVASTGVMRGIDLKLSNRGGLWHLKGHPDGLQEVVLHVAAHRASVIITPFDGADPGAFSPRA
jgi:hypothetical protein